MPWGKGGSGGALTIKSEYIFTTILDRDNYFAANPSELVEGLYVSAASNLYQYKNSAWVDVTPAIVGPKGADGADGTGGGGFGFAVYQNTGAAQSAPTDTWLLVNNNGLGVETNQTQLPDGVTTLLGTNSIDISQVPINSIVEIRLSIEFTPTTNNQLFEYRVSGVNSLGAFHLEDFGGQLRKGADVLHIFVRTMKVYVFDLVTTQNPLTVEVRTSAPSSVRCERFLVEVNSKGV